MTHKHKVWVWIVAFIAAVEIVALLSLFAFWVCQPYSWWMRKYAHNVGFGTYKNIELYPNVEPLWNVDPDVTSIAPELTVEADTGIHYLLIPGAGLAGYKVLPSDSVKVLKEVDYNYSDLWMTPPIDGSEYHTMFELDILHVPCDIIVQYHPGDFDSIIVHVT